ncbi:hypothetical protein HanXRQr2_Chr03g0088571 [Helianthus annuus]|uniref:Uncharacterized protein n=1 Tax=Helianthus annuus TaxID=4232 RepID=A0A9K3JCT0_HELAN|nr:hypothetical protein HanXRQr2_Chr03g0088571 [Helianthus annuus]KAJ0495785.1 hypothetical protein HanIR_Chr12g0612801 [Helianthus annuus]KAJ0591554.1 hypothetical protein HanHA300_Chr03g0074571 [Helianthus annuus]KAJ0606445.1 hypothetical protein HanHA89_Chr03g0085181 [Helianthus annuus]KAJ0772437.1 hypothetical protein HanOQP8_Chr03g0087301 [Helianthus annuus]
MMIVINKLEKMMDNISVTIEDMRRHAHLYSLDIRSAGLILNQFIVDSKLHLSLTGVSFMPPNEDQKKENSMSETLTILYRATLFIIHTDLLKYIRACEEADDVSYGIHFETERIIDIILVPRGIRKSLNDIHEGIKCLHAINQEAFNALSKCKEGWRHDPQVFYLVVCNIRQKRIF